MAAKRNAKRKSYEEHDDSDQSVSDADRGRGKQKRPVKRSKDESLSRLADSGDDDPGRDDSRGFQNWSQWLENLNRKEAEAGKDFIRSSEKSVRKQTEELRMRMKQGENALKAHGQIISTIVNQLYLESAQPEEPAHSSQTLQDQAQDAIATYRDMITRFRGMNETLHQTSPIELPADTMDKDKRDVKQIMQYARDDGEKLARGHLAPHTYESPVKDKSEISVHEQTAASMFQASRKTVRDSVGSVIAKQKDGLRQLISTLPAARHQL
ncbi:hypothetical protein E8E14_006182 [Neopestalotiopsis sp. 37M]|nr:hypothetical protein E8E14_006182 [Neopestalotiopsis sp. 37M]